MTHRAAALRMSRILPRAGLVVGLAVAALAGGGATVEAGKVTGVTPVSDDRGARGASAGGGGRGVTIYLDGHGGRIAGGDDDARARTSWIAAEAPGGAVTVPAWTGGARRWSRMVACVRAGFGALAVDIVDEEPASGVFTRIMIGGKPALLGYGSDVAGVAPTGAVLTGAVGFVFSAGLGDDPDEVCESALHEIGHTLGLDHTVGCHDLMSYAECGARSFRDEDLACGETRKRACDDGARTQNSWRKLVAAVGLRDADDAAGASDDAVDTDDGEDADGGDDAVDLDEADDDAGDDAAGYDADVDAESADGDAAARCPGHQPPAGTAAVAIVDLPASVPGDRWLAIDIEAHAPAGIEDVALTWRRGAELHAWVCSEPAGDVGVSCEREGDRFRFWVPAGKGGRVLVALARDAAGNVLAGPPRSLLLTGDD